MRFAIYSRKSKFTGKGESIDNQIDECRRYIMSQYPDTKESEIFIYEDEGYSGKNTNRPQFQQMMAEEEREPFDLIVVYRLDRISRNMADFAVLMDKLTKKDTSFYSTNERFDTSTLSGQMMMTISAAFAQFERQIIAERVKDNVYRLAKTGRWLGGTPPLGFSSEKVEFLDEAGTERKCHKLTENEDEIEIVRLIYAKYLETHSITKVETFMLNSSYKTRKNADFHVSTLRYILTNPTYCTADKESLEFFRSKDCDIADIDEKCNGERGFMGYKKTLTQSDDKREATDMSNWTIALGKHKGIIPSADWIEVQNIIEGNSEKKVGFRQSHNPVALLSGVLRCRCGSYMRPKYHKANKDGEKPFSYMCELKETSKRQQCDCHNVNGRVVDKMVCDALLDYESDNSVFAGYVKQLSDIGKKNDNIESLIRTQAATIAKNKKNISGLLRMVGDDNRLTAEYIHKEIA
ncbi:MAG: recombinase family protein [Oscillospiraceae bacterium]|nr:recombinase family protein [Oscillospiraceae bacterium]